MGSLTDDASKKLQEANYLIVNLTAEMSALRKDVKALSDRVLVLETSNPKDHDILETKIDSINTDLTAKMNELIKKFSLPRLLAVVSVSLSLVYGFIRLVAFIAGHVKIGG